MVEEIDQVSGKTLSAYSKAKLFEIKPPILGARCVGQGDFGCTYTSRNCNPFLNDMNTITLMTLNASSQFAYWKFTVKHSVERPTNY